MAYNLESLVQILEQILHPDQHRPWYLDPDKKPEIESLLEKACFLKEFFGNSSAVTGDKIESLESRIRDVAHDAEDILESHLTDRILSIRNRKGLCWISPPDLQKVIEELDVVKEEIMKIMDGSQIAESSLPSTSSGRDPNPKNITVGLREDLIQLKHRLAGDQSNLEIIPIVGMGGIGKTTLARKVYDDPLVVSHFDTRAWITISQQYDVKGILVGLLGCVIGKLTDQMLQKENAELALLLYQNLIGRRYLIVLDDMWNTKDWDHTKKFFPNDHKSGSRIIVTTREQSVANYAGSDNLHHQMKLLNPVESWNLLREKVFAQETCPPELENLGKEIANKCKGLPLAIHVIGGILSQEKRKQESWVQVAKDVSSVVASDDDQFSKILSLSYNHLPNHLKPCFLYMAAFPENNEIRASKLIKLWVAEGFLKPISDKNLEEAAQVYLKALVDRNLIFVHRQEIKGNMKSYSIHDLLRDLCMRKAHQEKFIHVRKLQDCDDPVVDTICLRRVSVHSSCGISRIYHDSMESSTQPHTFLGIGSARLLLTPLIFRFPLLRVLDILRHKFKDFPEKMLQLVNLRYLALAIYSTPPYSSHRPPPLSISKLWNLQTLIVFKIDNHVKDLAIYEIFNMPQLRHIKFKRIHHKIDLPRGKSFAVLENLQTLTGIEIGPDFDKVLALIPHLKKLGIYCGLIWVHGSIDLTCLRYLETLKCSSVYLHRSFLGRESDYISEVKSNRFVSSLIFPLSLKKLVMKMNTIPPGFMKKIGDLPNLEVLKLKTCTFGNPTWEPTEGEFCQLQLLLLEDLNLVNWVADETHFPRIQCLVIRNCERLEEIPSGIGDISTLEKIEVHYCSPSLVASARKIQEGQLEYENTVLQVLISGWNSQ